MSVKCIKCKYMQVKDRDYYDADNVRRTDVKYICQITGKEIVIVRERACEDYKEKDKR